MFLETPRPPATVSAPTVLLLESVVPAIVMFAPKYELAPTPMPPAKVAEPVIELVDACVPDTAKTVEFVLVEIALTVPPT
jgi:hypothetical protein